MTVGARMPADCWPKLAMPVAVPTNSFLTYFSGSTKMAGEDTLIITVVTVR